MVAFWFAAVLHGSVYAVSPVFAGLVVYLFFAAKPTHPERKAFFLGCLALALWFAAYLPVILFFRANHIVAAPALSQGWVGSIGDYFVSLVVGLRLLLQALLPGRGYWFLDGILFAALAVGSYRNFFGSAGDRATLRRIKHRNKKRGTPDEEKLSFQSSSNIPIVAVFTFQIVIFFAIATSDRLLGYYFLPVFGGLALLISAIVIEYFKTPYRKLTILLQVCFLLALFYAASLPSLSSFVSHSAFARSETLDSQTIAAAIAQQVQTLHDQYHYSDYHFFNITAFTADSLYEPDSAGPFLKVNYDVYFWPALEAKFHEQLVQADERSSARDYRGNDNPNIWFVVCIGRDVGLRNYCPGTFQYEYPGWDNFEVLQNTSDYTLFEFSRQNL